MCIKIVCVECREIDLCCNRETAERSAFKSIRGDYYAYTCVRCSHAIYRKLHALTGKRVVGKKSHRWDERGQRGVEMKSA